MHFKLVLPLLLALHAHGLPCPTGSYASGASCPLCAAGTFSYFANSTACQACPASTGSVAGMSLCVSCVNGTSSCKTASGSACSSCITACKVCAAGTYSSSGASCVKCGPGTYSATSQATSSDICTNCDSGFTTRPIDSGLTACAVCAAMNQPLPAHAGYLDVPPDPLVCSWACGAGYLRVNYSEASFVARAYTVLNYSSTEAPQVFHGVNDYCCNPTLVNMPGTFLAGCNRTFDGIQAACPPVPNGYYFIQGSAPKINRCADWACNAGYYTNGTACLMQPVCAAGYTYQRDAVTGETVPLATGSFACVPCSRCQSGSEVLVPCNRTVDTVCIKCNPTSFSVSGSPCLSSPPLGFIGVIVQLTSVPVIQGRPMYYYDGTPIDWSSASGFSINTYTACQAIPAYQAYSGNDVPCRRTDVQQQLCQYPACNWQCKPWNGSVGWYMLRGQCAACAYDTTCTSTQYSNLAGCGPTSAALCTPCPLLPLANAVGWLNPGKLLSGPYPCTPVCKSGFILNTNGSACVFCPNIPNNSKVVGDNCAWQCSLGFQQSGPLSCAPCVGVPLSCDVGSYLGYLQGSQCARCLRCTNTVVNSIYTTAGLPNGPNTCRLTCNPGYFVDPDYGFDAFGNPVACNLCSRPACVKGASYLVSCTYTVDAYCQQCSLCPIGTQVQTPCSIGADTVCTGCNPSLLPANASWTSSGCSLWSCSDGFYAQGGRCVPCMPSSSCKVSDRFGYAAVQGCGVCTPCDPSVLLPLQCFNGDGKCGTTYWCGFTTTVHAVGTSSTSVGPTTTSSRMTTAITTTPPPFLLPYATLLTLTLASNASLVNLTRHVVCQPVCSLRVLSVTRGNVTTYFSRRLLSDTVTVNIGVVSPQPPALTVAGSLSTVSVAVSQSVQVTNASVLGDPAQFVVFVQGYSQTLDSTEYTILYATAGAYGSAVVILVMCCCIRWRRKGGSRRSGAGIFGDVRINKVNP